MPIALAHESTTLDAATVQDRIDELAKSLDAGEIAELKALTAFQRKCEDYCSDWEHGEIAIHESYFQDYIQQMIDDVYNLPKSTDWPHCHLKLDIEAAAEEARGDYTSIELDGQTFYVR